MSWSLLWSFLSPYLPADDADGQDLQRELLDLPTAIRRRVVRRALETLRGDLKRISSKMANSRRVAAFHPAM